MPKFTDGTYTQGSIRCEGCPCCKGEIIDRFPWCVECYANYGKSGGGVGVMCMNINECGWPDA